jgi:hypothetical protein
MKKDNEIYTQCRHELNHLRVLVQNILILDIPIVEDHFGPDRIFMDEVMPSSGKVGNNMLLELPSESGGKHDQFKWNLRSPKKLFLIWFLLPTRIIISPRILRSTASTTRNSWTAGGCSNMLKPLLKRPTLKWILCMRCLDYSTMGIHHRQPLHCHAIGC